MMDENISPRQLALTLLARREHSRLELLHKLQAKGFELALIEAALESLAEKGLQSDARFAQAFSHDRIRMSYGPRYIAAVLQQRGIEESLIQRALSEQSPDFWQKQLRTLWLKKFGATRELLKNSIPERARQYRFLSHRGFEAQDIHDLLNQVVHHVGPMREGAPSE